MRIRTATAFGLLTLVCATASARADLLLSDLFDGTTIAPEWSGTFVGNTTAWTYAVDGGMITVSDIQPTSFPPGCDVSGGVWSEVALTRPFAPAGDFVCDMLASWASPDGGARTMQAIWIVFLDCNDQVLAQVGYVDAWAATTGARAAQLGGTFVTSGAGSLPAAGSALVRVARTGGSWSASVGGQTLLTGEVGGVPRKLQLVFSYYASPLCAGGNTSIGDLTVDSIQISGTPGAPPIGDLDGSQRVDGADLGLLLGAWGNADCAADINGDGTVDGADLGLLLGHWGP